MRITFNKNSWLGKIEYLVIFIGVALVIIANKSGVGLSWDSTDYMAVGRNMASGHGTLDVTGLPMTVRPPGVSALICVGDWLSLTPNSTFLILNALSAGISIYFTMRILNEAGVKRSISLPTLIIVALSPSLLNMYSMAWSEPIFIALVMTALWIALFPRRIIVQILLGPIFVAMFFVRYVGPFFSLPIAIVSAFIYSRRSSLINSMFKSGSIFLLSLIPQYLWLMRNKGIDGTLTGVRTGAGGSYFQPIKTMIATYGSWIIGHDPMNGTGGIYLSWNDYSFAMKILGLVFASAILCLVAMMFLKFRALESVRIALSLFFVAFFYMAFSVIRYVHAEIGPLDSRMMIGVYIPLLLTFAIGLQSLASSKVPQKLLSFFFVCLISAFGAQSIWNSITYGSQGRYWASKVHQSQPLHAFVKTLDENSQFMSNEPQMLYSVVKRSPIYNQYMNERQFPRECTERFMIWYATSYLPEAKPIGGEVLYSDALGEVIKLSNCSTPASTFWP